MLRDSKSTLSFDLHIDSGSFEPYYQQIVNQIRNVIRSGAISQGEEFYSEGEVATLLGISKMPVRQAFARLRAEGLLLIERGKKPVIGSERLRWDFRRLHGFREEMKGIGLNPHNKILGLDETAADERVAKALRLNRSRTVYTLVRLYYISDEPVAIVTHHLPLQLFRGLREKKLEDESLYRVYEDVYHIRIGSAEEEISATAASKEQATILGVSTGAPLIYIEEVTYDVNRTAIEFSTSLLRADRYSVTVRAERSPDAEPRRRAIRSANR